MKIILHRNFEKKLIKSSPKIQKALKNRLNLFLKNPLYSLLSNHPLTGDRKGQWSINITGDWRAIYISKGGDTVVFIDIDTHSNLYK